MIETIFTCDCCLSKYSINGLYGVLERVSLPSEIPYKAQLCAKCWSKFVDYLLEIQKKVKPTQQ